MAYIDDNNELAAGKGKDPIKELDDELDQLLAELKDMEAPENGADHHEDEDAADADAVTSGQVTVDADAQSGEDAEDLDVRLPEKEAEAGGRAPKKRSKAPIIIAVILIIALICAGGWYLFDKVLKLKLGGEDDKAVTTVTFTDPELGEVTVKKVEGALNTYDTDNLVKNDDGFYEYYVDGKVSSEIGIDIAEYQGDVDFEKVKKAGVDFVVLRIGGRYYSDEGATFADGRFDEYYEKASAAGLKIGAYFFSQAISTEEAAEEAEFTIKLLNGRKLDYPIAFDWEIIEDDEARTDNVSGKTITAMAEKFCDTINGKGYKSLVYASTSLMLQSYDFETMKDYEFWLADYREFPIMYYDFAIWQYAKDGTVNGVDGTVDLNICFKPY